MAHQRNQCGLMLLCHKGNRGPFLPNSDRCGASVTKSLHSLVRKNEIQSAFARLSPNELVQEFKVVSVKGVEYRKGSPLMTSSYCEKPVFGKVVSILKVQNTLVFVFQRLEIMYYETDLNSFRVKHTKSFSVKPVSDITYNHKLLLIQSVGACHIVVPCRSYLEI